MPIKNDKWRFWAGLIVILILYSGYQLVFGDNKAAEDIPRKWRHFFRFGIVIAVYATGTLGLGKMQQKWLLQLWHLIHTTLIAALLLIGLWDWGIQPLSYSMRRLGNSIHEFLISPLLYLATMLTGRLSGPRTSSG